MAEMAVETVVGMEAAMAGETEVDIAGYGRMTENGRIQ